MWFLLLFIPVISKADLPDLPVGNTKYSQAIDTTTHAVLKRSGLESQFLEIQHGSETHLKKWVKDNHIEYIADVALFTTPVILKHRVKFRTGDFSVEAVRGRFELDFGFGF